AEDLGDLRILSRVHTNFASTYYHFDMVDSALVHSKKALELKRELGDEYGIRLNLLNVGVILAEYDSTIDEGIAYLKEARARSKNDPVMINDIITNMVWIHTRKGNYDLGLAYLDSAHRGNDTIDSEYTRQAIHRLGKDLFLKLGDYEKAY